MGANISARIFDLCYGASFCIIRFVFSSLLRPPTYVALVELHVVQSANMRRPPRTPEGTQGERARREQNKSGGECFSNGTNAHVGDTSTQLEPHRVVMILDEMFPENIWFANTLSLLRVSRNGTLTVSRVTQIRQKILRIYRSRGRSVASRIQSSD